MLVDDLQSDLSHVHHRTNSTSLPSPVDVLSSADHRDVQTEVRCQQVFAKDQLSHVPGE